MRIKFVKDIADIQWEGVNATCILCSATESQRKHVFRFEILPKPFELRECGECGLLLSAFDLTFRSIHRMRSWLL